MLYTTGSVSEPQCFQQNRGVAVYVSSKTRIIEKMFVSMIRRISSGLLAHHQVAFRIDSVLKTRKFPARYLTFMAVDQ